MKDTEQPATSAKTYDRFTDDERAAMKERAQELKAATRRGSRGAKADGESDVLEKIAEMPESDRAIAERLHAIIKASAPELSPKTWYGMPAYAKDGKVVCFFQSSHKFKTRYSTFGFNDSANLDDGTMWPSLHFASWGEERQPAIPSAVCGGPFAESLPVPHRWAFLRGAAVPFP